MTAAAPTVTLADLRTRIAALPAAEQRLLTRAMMRDTVKDKTYQQSRMGAYVKRYMEWKQFEWGADEHTLSNREPCLWRFAVDFADLDLKDFEGRDGVELIRAFLREYWGDAAPSTLTNRTSILRDFFRWAYREDLIDRDPMLKIDSPRRRGRRRDAHPKDEIVRLTAAQPKRRDRLALGLLARQGLRKSELQGVQLGHFDFANLTLSILGKGTKYAVVDLFEDLARQLETYCQERALAEPRRWRTEHLLFTERPVRRGMYPSYWWHVHEYRQRPLATSSIQRWWRACLERADMEPFPMHELRHTAGTHFHLAVGDYELTRQFMRHEDIATTATYIHVGNPHLRRALRSVPAWGDE